MPVPTRRAILAGLAATAAAPVAVLATAAGADRVGEPLSPWRPGLLDIHHIATGRGDATLVIGPDGTSLLIDAGASARPDPAMLPARPGPQRRAGEWIARYAARRLADTGHDGLDMLLVTHLHPDHIGGVGEETPQVPSRPYRLTGVAEVASLLPVARIIDPDYPDYGYPPFEDKDASENYVAFIRDHAARGGHVERFQVGSGQQIGPCHGGDPALFAVRNLAAKGTVWTGAGEAVRAVFPPREQLAHGDHPNVNACSIAIRLSSGRFRYFHGGDLTDWADGGGRPWMDALSPASAVAGPVDVAVAPHHGMFDAAGPAMVRALAARVWIISAWHAAHPSLSTLEQLFNERLYPGPRAIYATGLAPAAEQTMGRLTRRMTSRDGHVVVRVDPDGGYRTIVTASDDEADRVRMIVPGQPPSQ
jgi:beta-lactamase superfamily II metal-dependent hydrolase